MKNKKWLLLLVIAFPSAFWLLLETSTIHSRKLAIYGPRSLDANGDTVYNKTAATFIGMEGHAEILNTEQYPLFALMFVREKYKDEGYRLTGLWEYLNYKPQKIEPIPLILVAESASAPVLQNLSSLKEHGNVHFYHWPKAGYDSLEKSYFSSKPYFVDHSFLVLLDGERRVRGYYDTRFAAEVKRLIDEYQHLRLKEEKQKLIKSNEIEQQT